MGRRFNVNDRFWSKVDKSGDCWEWNACKDNKGYGRFYLDGRQTYAHRTALMLSGVMVPDDMFVCHECDNPGCVNPNHLFVGSCADNLRDMAEKGRSTIGERNPNAKLNELDVRLIRELCDCLPHQKIADWFDVSVAAVSNINARRSWAHLI